MVAAAWAQRVSVAEHRSADAALSGAVAGTAGPRPSMGPGAPAAEAEIVGVGLAHGLAGLRLRQAKGDAVALGVGDRLFLGIEGQAYLRFHIARTGPAHHRLS